MRKLHRSLRQIFTDQAGYTLVELITSMAIFGIITMVAIGSFVTISGSARKVTAQRQVQQDVRYNIEQIAREARASMIDYQFYAQAAPTPSPTNVCDVANQRMLVLLHTRETPSDADDDAIVTGKQSRVFYYYDADPTKQALYRYEQSDVLNTPPCDAALLTALTKPENRLTVKDLRVFGASFNVQPLSNPIPPNNDFSNTDPARYMHPRVTIAMRVGTPTADTAATYQDTINKSVTTIQTTVSVRAYPLEEFYAPSGSTPGPLPAPAPPPPTVGTFTVQLRYTNTTLCGGSSDGAVPGEKVELNKGGYNEDEDTNAAGSVTFNNVPPGNGYRLEIDKDIRIGSAEYEVCDEPGSNNGRYTVDIPAGASSKTLFYRRTEQP